MEPMVRPARLASWNRLMNRQGTVWNRSRQVPNGTGTGWNWNRMEPERNRTNPDRGHAHWHAIIGILVII